MKPLPQVYAAAADLHLLTDEVDLLRHLELLCDIARWVVPSCVGVSVTVLVDGETYTLTASSEELAVLDAAQYLDGTGPCVDAAQHCRDVQVDDVLDEDRWQFFEQAAATRAVRSSLSLPLHALPRPSGAPGCACRGSLNLYASAPHAFAAGARELLAELFRVPLEQLVSNADLSFSTRELARQLPARLQEKALVDAAATVLAGLRSWTQAQARARLRHAADRAGMPVRAVAEVVLAFGTP